MLNQVSVVTLGSGRRAVSPKPRSIASGKASYGGVSTHLVSRRNGSVTQSRSTLASRPGSKPGTTHRVGMMGTARAGGNPRTTTQTRHAVGGRVSSRHTVRSSLGGGIRIGGLSVSGSRAYSSRGMLGSQRSQSGRNVQYGGASSSKTRSHAGQLGFGRSALNKVSVRNTASTQRRVGTISTASHSHRNGLNR